MATFSGLDQDAAHLQQRIERFHTIREQILKQVRDVGNNDVDAQQLGFGKHQAGIDHDDVIAIADGHAVHPELAHPAERNYVQFPVWHS